MCFLSVGMVLCNCGCWCVGISLCHTPTHIIPHGETRVSDGDREEGWGGWDDDESH